MNKYKVLKSYPKQITNSGRLVTLSPGKSVYLKKESQVVRLVKLGFIKPVVEMPKRVKKPKKVQKVEAKAEPKKQDKPEYLNKKKKNKGNKSESQD